MSFMREGSGGQTTVDHGWDLPVGVREMLDEILKEEKDMSEKDSAANGVEPTGPFVSKTLGIKDSESSNYF